MEVDRINKICERVEKDGIMYLEDYRLKKALPYIKGKLKDLDTAILTSGGLGELIGCISLDLYEYDCAIVEYKNNRGGKSYAFGLA